MDTLKSAVAWDDWEAGKSGRALGEIAGNVLAGGAAARMVKGAKHGDGPGAPGPVKENLPDYFQPGAPPPKASDLARYAEQQGWEKRQTENGPPKYVDENGIVRMTLKEGSARAPGSENPHIELRDENGQRIDPHGNPVTRKSPGNHTPIEWDW